MEVRRSFFCHLRDPRPAHAQKGPLNREVLFVVFDGSLHCMKAPRKVVGNMFGMGVIMPPCPGI